MAGFVRLTHAPLGYDPHNVLSLSILLHENAYQTGPRARLVLSNYAPKQQRRRASSWRQSYVTRLRRPTAGIRVLRFRQARAGTPNGCDEPGRSRIFCAAAYSPSARASVERNGESRRRACRRLNRAFDRRYFPNGDAIGHSLKPPDLEDRPPEIVSVPGIADVWLRIVGNVGDALKDGLLNPVKPLLDAVRALNWLR